VPRRASVAANTFASNHPCANRTAFNGFSSANDPVVPTGEAARVAPERQGTKFYLTAVTLVCGDINFKLVKEWLLWYIAAGFDSFVVYIWMPRDGQVRYLEAMAAKLRPLCLGIEVIVSSYVPMVKKFVKGRLRKVPDHEWRLSRLWDVNIPHVVMAQRYSFELAVNSYRHRSEWMAFLDLDEFVSPGSDATPVRGQSFPQWLSSLPATIDWVYLRWEFYPLAAGHTLTFDDPVVFDPNNFFRFDNSQIWRTPNGLSGKSVIRPRFFHGVNTIHNFDPIDWKEYDPLVRKVVPSLSWTHRLENGTEVARVLPRHCNVAETMYGQDEAAMESMCQRGKDTWVVNHYRRRSTHEKDQIEVMLGKRDQDRYGDDPRKWPISPEYGAVSIGSGKCELIAATCALISPDAPGGCHFAT